MEQLPRSEWVEGDGVVFIFNDEQFPRFSARGHAITAFTLRKLTQLDLIQIRAMLDLGYIGPARIEHLQVVGDLLKEDGINVWYTGSGSRVPRHIMSSDRIPFLQDSAEFDARVQELRARAQARH